MTLVSLIAALLLEQWRPLDRRNPVFQLFIRYADFLERQFNAGENRHGAIAWVLAVVPVLAVTGAVYSLLHELNPLLAWAWNVFVLYLTMGFRQFSHAFTGIAEALRAGDLQKARELLGQWRGQPAAEYTPAETARVAIEQGLIYSHRYVFGVIVWFLVLPGPVGAVLYRIAAVLGERWGVREEQEFGAFGRFAAGAFELIDAIPARLTAISFAVVGNFQDAVDCWHSQALSWVKKTQGIILASGAGAMGVRLGEPLPQGGNLQYRPELGTGDEADVDYMQTTVGLIWRSLVLWMLLLLLMSIANWAG